LKKKNLEEKGMDTKPEKKKYAFLIEGKEGVVLQYYRCDPVPDACIKSN